MRHAVLNRIAKALAAGSVMLLAACGSNPAERSLYDPILRRVTQAQPAAQFTALNAAGVDAIIVSVEARDTAALFVRRGGRDGATHWISPDLVGLTTRNGIATATRGLGADLMSAQVDDVAALVLSRRAGQAERFHGYLDGNERIEIRSFICDISSRGQREVDLGRRIATTELMQEDCVNPDTSFQNLYWVAVDARDIVQSRQWISNQIGPLALRKVLR